MSAPTQIGLLTIALVVSFDATAGSRAVLLDCCSTPANEGAPVALTAQVPSQEFIRNKPVDFLLHGGVYDAKDDLLLVAGQSGVSMVDPVSLDVKGVIPVPYVFGVIVSNGIGYCFGVELDGTGMVYQISPSAGSILQAASIPSYGYYYTSVTGADVSADGRLLYLFTGYAPQGDELGKIPPPGPPGATMFVFNTQTMTIVSSWKLRNAAGGLTLAGPGSLGYFAEGSTIYRCNVFFGNNCASVTLNPSNGGSVGPVLSEDKSTLYMALNNEIFVVDAQTLSVIAQAALPYAPTGIALSPDGKYLYTTPFISPYVSNPFVIVDTSSLAAVGTIPTTYTFYSPPSVVFVPR